MTRSVDFDFNNLLTPSGMNAEGGWPANDVEAMALGLRVVATLVGLSDVETLNALNGDTFADMMQDAFGPRPLAGAPSYTAIFDSFVRVGAASGYESTGPKRYRVAMLQDVVRVVGPDGQPAPTKGRPS